MKLLGKFLTAFYPFLILSAGLPIAARAAPSANVEAVELDEISLVGVTVFNVTELEKVIEISAGDRLDRAKVVQTARNIQDLYRSSGYESVKIETRLTRRTPKAGGTAENVLEIVVSEGKPTRIAEIAVEYDLPGWSSRLASASAKIGLRPTEIYDREKLLNGFRSMQDALTSWDFLSPKVEESTVEQVGPPADAGKDLVGGTARWVRVRVKVQLGDRVSFAYRDNTIFPNSQLSSWIEEQRLLGFSLDYVDRIRERFEEEYRKLGYDRIKIDVYTFEDAEKQRRRITYAFNEGPRVEIDRIEFDGNSIFTAAALRDQFYDRSSPSVSRGYYVAKDVEQSAELLIEWMKSQGYLAAKLVSISRTYRPAGDRVDLVVYVYEGEQTIIDSIRYEGLTVFSPNELTEALGNRAGKPLNLYALNDGLEKIKAKYRERGYLDIQIANEGTNRLVLYSQENRVADVSLELVEGIQYRVTKIEIEGLRKTLPIVIERELELHEGDVLSERLWYLSEAKIRRLGIFASASVKAFPDPTRKDGKILKILVEEGSPGLIAGGIGARNDLGLRGFGQVQYTNLWGKNHTVALNATANRRYRWLGDTAFCPSTKQQAEAPNDDHCFVEFDTSIGYVWPWFSLGQTTFRPRFSFERTQFKNFDADTVALQSSWERVLARGQSWGLTGAVTYAMEIVNQYNANFDGDNQRLRIGSVGPTLIFDRRDNALAPTRGTYTTIQYDIARPFLGSQSEDVAAGQGPIAYQRVQFRNDLYVPLPKAIDLFLSVRAGFEHNEAIPPEDYSGPNYSIPLIKQFTLGGVGSLRGFEEQSLNAGAFAVRGNLSYLNYRAQVDLPFAGSMKFGPFIDTANLYLDDRSLTNGYRYGVGAGFHYKSPVGPVNFDLGVNPSPQGTEDAYKIHFSIGNI
ncbi:MAG: BamA/TamA family outer membrane protein [Bdellovibrionales bacterium]|nr:BamA/TamA family outer membrane protein [Bdellovibrionales bacterium]